MNKAWVFFKKTCYILILLGIFFLFFPWNLSDLKRVKAIFGNSLSLISTEDGVSYPNREVVSFHEKKGWVFWKEIIVNPNIPSEWEKTPPGMEKCIIYPDKGWIEEEQENGETFFLTGKQSKKFPQSPKFRLKGGIGENLPIKCYVMIRSK